MTSGNRFFGFATAAPSRLGLAVAVALLLASPVRAALAADAPAWGIKQLMQGMAEIRSERRAFTERKYVPMLTAPLESAGVLIYRAPAHLEKHTLTPRDESMVLDQGIIVLESRARHLKRTLMANQYPAVGAFVESMRATLAGDLDALNRYYQVQLSGQAANWRLQLVPSDAEARKLLREITIQGSRSRITRIEILAADNDRTVMSVGADLSEEEARQ